MALPHKGSWGLPDFGLTEKVQKFIAPQKTYASSGGSNLFGGSGGQVAGTTDTQKPTTNSGGGGKTTGSSGSAPGPQTSAPAYNPDQVRQDRGQQERDYQAEREGQIRSNIDSAYQPVFEELDRQLGLVGGQQAALEGQVGTLAGQQVDSVNTEEGIKKKELEGFKGGEETKAKSSLTDLAGNIRNLLQGASFYLGSKGSADSSAAGAASEAIVQSADKTRGSILNTKNQALSAIDQKISAVTDLASDQRKKIDDFKTNKLFEISQWGIGRINELNSQKASASGQKAIALSQMIEDTQSEFVNRLRALDDDVYSYKESVATWERERAAELEDFKSKYDIAGSYSSNTDSAYSSILGNLPSGFSTVGGTQAPVDQGPTGYGTPAKKKVSSLTDMVGLTPLSTGATPLQLNA